MINQGWIYQNQVDKKAAGLSILEFYTKRYPHSSRIEWQNRIESGQVQLEGKQTYPDQLLLKGQVLSYHRPPWQEPDIPLTLNVIYEDADILVISKPSGLPVLPGGGFLEHTVLHQLKKRFPKNPPLPIHRLGRGTSGLVLMARSHQARSHLSEQMRSRNVYKEYRALIGPEQDDQPLSRTFEIHQAIGKVPYPGWGEVYAANNIGLTAYTICQVLQRRQTSTLLSVIIKTGRPHQIRIHLASIGYPLLGDPLYMSGGHPKPVETNTQSRPVPGDCGYYLHAHVLRLIHPQTNQPIQFTSSPPSSLQPQ